MHVAIRANEQIERRTEVELQSIEEKHEIAGRDLENALGKIRHMRRELHEMRLNRVEVCND